MTLGAATTNGAAQPGNATAAAPVAASAPSARRKPRRPSLASMREVDQGIATLQPGSDGLTGQVRIGATHTFNIGLIPECVALFLARHPTVRVRVEELAADQIGTRLQSGELDLGIAYRPTGPTELWFEPLYNEEMVLVVGGQL